MSCHVSRANFLFNIFLSISSARNDSIEGVRYQPRVRKRKPNRGEDCGDNGEGDEEISPEELSLNQNIITLVKQHDVLYDRKRVRDSKNLAAKNEAWTIIANSLDVTGYYIK